MLSKEHCLEIANIIWNQLVGTTQVYVLFSWGIAKRSATTYNNMAALRLSVNGLFHKGFVVIAYDEGTDYYIIYFIDKGNKVVHSVSDVCFDMMGEIIDSFVEKKHGMSDEEYQKAVNAEYM